MLGMGSPYAEHVNVTFSFSSIIVDIGCDVKEGGSIKKKRHILRESNG